MAIVDVHGRPIQLADLQEEQTSKLGYLRTEYGTHPSRGLTPAKLAQILDDAERGDLRAQCDLFEDMEEKDGHIMAEMGKRKRAVIGLDWDIMPPRNPSPGEKKATDQVREIIHEIRDIEDVMFDILDGIGKGYSCTEITWDRQGKEWWPVELEYRPPSWFRLPLNDQDDIRLRDNSADGAELLPFLWIQHRPKAKSGYVARGGLSRVLAWPYLFKNYSVRDLAELLEIYGLPLRLGKYPPGSSDKEKSTLLKAVVGIGHAAAGIVPQGMEIDFQKAAEGNADPFMVMIDWCERTQSKAILGQVLSAEAKATGMGSGVANLQGEVRVDLRDADARQLGSTLTRDLVYPIAALNAGGVDSPRRSPRFVFDIQEPEDLKVYADSLPKLVSIGTRIPERWVHDKLGIPEPAQGEATLMMPPAGTAPSGAPGGTAAAKAANPPADIPAQQADRLAAESDQATLAMIERVRGIVDQAKDLPDLQRRIEAAFADADAEALGRAFRTALSAAHLAGRYDVLNQGGGN